MALQAEVAAPSVRRHERLAVAPCSAPVGSARRQFWAAVKAPRPRPGLELQAALAWAVAPAELQAAPVRRELALEPRLALAVVQAEQAVLPRVLVLALAGLEAALVVQAVRVA